MDSEPGTVEAGASIFTEYPSGAASCTPRPRVRERKPGRNRRPLESVGHVSVLNERSRLAGAIRVVPRATFRPVPIRAGAFLCSENLGVKFRLTGIGSKDKGLTWYQKPVE